jgi:hypothetical protein
MKSTSHKTNREALERQIAGCLEELRSLARRRGHRWAARRQLLQRRYGELGRELRGMYGLDD